MKVRGPTRWMNRGSSIGNARPSNTSSAAMPSVAARVTLSRLSGSSTSMRIGPTSRSQRSMSRMREAWMQCSTPSTITDTWASAMFRCG